MGDHKYLFDREERELLHIKSTIQRKIENIPHFFGEKRKAAVREAENEVEEANGYLKQMDRSAQQERDSGARYRMLNKVKTYEGDITKLKRDLNSARNSSPDSGATRQELFSGAPGDIQVAALDQRSKLLYGNDRLTETDDRLLRTHQTAVESENIGIETLGHLHQQRGQIERAGDNLNQIDDNISRGRRIMRTMNRRVLTNKAILILTNMLLLAIIGVIIWLKWFN